MTSTRWLQAAVLAAACVLVAGCGDRMRDTTGASRSGAQADVLRDRASGQRDR